MLPFATAYMGGKTNLRLSSQFCTMYYRQPGGTPWGMIREAREGRWLNQRLSKSRVGRTYVRRLWHSVCSSCELLDRTAQGSFTEFLLPQRTYTCFHRRNRSSKVEA